MSQKTIYHNGKIATNSTPYFAEAMAIGDGEVVATGTSSSDTRRLRSLRRRGLLR